MCLSLQKVQDKLMYFALIEVQLPQLAVVVFDFNAQFAACQFVVIISETGENGKQWISSYGR